MTPKAKNQLNTEEEGAKGITEMIKTGWNPAAAGPGAEE